MNLNLVVFAAKSIKLIFLIFIVFFTQLEIDAKVRNSEENSMSCSIIMGDMIELDTLLLNGTTIKVNHADYYWLRINSKVEREQKSSLHIIRKSFTIKSITNKINNILFEVNKMISNKKWMEDSIFRNHLWIILKDIERLMDNLEILGEPRKTPK